MQSNNNYLISVVICTFNTKELTLECLGKLKKSIDYLGKPVEVILVENGNDGTGKDAKKKFPQITVIDPGENTGFARGNNLGLSKISKKSKYILLLNSDALVKDTTLRDSVIFMENHEDCDVFGPRLVLGNNVFQPSGGYLPNPISVTTWLWGLDLVPGLNRLLKPVHPNYPEFFRENRDLGWVMGAFLFMRRRVLVKTKGMDESFFMYMEEVEWCKRIKDAGFNIWYTPDFEITHLDKASSKKDPEKLKKIYGTEIKGIIYFLKKYYGRHMWWLSVSIRLALWLRYFAFRSLNSGFRAQAYKDALGSI